MIKKKLLSVLLGATILMSAVIPSFTQVLAQGETTTSTEQSEETPLKLWYNTPAANNHTGWEQYALPIGNGHMGAMVFGMTDTERIQMNEKTLWTGGPNSNIQKPTNADKYGNKNVADPAGTMKKVVDRAFENLYAGSTADSKPLEYKPNNRHALGNYQNFAEMYIDFNHKTTTNYSRSLDLRTGVSDVSYDYNGVTYSREMFANYPDNVMVYKMTASEKGALDFTLRPEIPHKVSTASSGNVDKSTYGKTGTVFAEGDTITLDGALKHNDMQFEGQYKVIPTGGTMTATNDENNDNGKITITGADSAYVIIALGTDYINDYPLYKGEDPHAGVTDRIAKASALGYDKLYANQQADYKELFDRVSLDLNGAEFPADKTTSQLLADYKAGKRSQYFEQLYFQYGRYLLISGSREGSLPTNLQGVWNDQESPQWQADYHTNINLQMNYWPAMEANLAETAIPLVEYVDSLREPGRVTFQKTWGIEPAEGDTESGWIVNCSNGPMGFTGNIDSDASFTATGSAFLGQNLFDYYAFTKDKDYLASTIYPVIKEICKTYIQILEPGRTEADKDKLYMVPSYSSEQGPWTVGTTFDQQLIYQIFNDTAIAADDLGIDAEFAAQLREMMPKLNPLEIGESGQIKEWIQEAKYNKTADGKTLGEAAGKHRHVSQLMLLYPGNFITDQTPELMEAAQKTLNFRGDDATGWSMANKLNLWARTGDGNHAYTLFKNLLSVNTLNNMLDTHTPFQIDGNFGGTAGVTEMLLQSQGGYINILPALPDVWGKGSYKGLVARGNFEVDVEWLNKEATSIAITSKEGNDVQLKSDRIAESKVTDSKGNKVNYTVLDNGMISFPTTKGETYNVATVNRAELATVVEQAKAVTAIDYTTGSIQTLNNAVAQAQAILDAETFTEKQVTDAVAAVKDALANLVARGDDYLYALNVVKYTDAVAQTIFATSANWSAVVEKKSELMTAIEQKDAESAARNAVSLDPAADAVMKAIKTLFIADQATMFDDTNPAVQFGYGPKGPDPTAGNGGVWYKGSNPKYQNGQISVCKSAWSWCALEFTGSRVTYLTEKAKGSSYCEVYIDDKLVDTIDTFDGGNGLPQTVVFDSADYPEVKLDNGKHTIKVVTTDKWNPSSTGLIFRLEGFNVYSGERFIADKTDLIKQISKAQAVKQGTVTADSWNSLQKQLAIATTTLYDIMGTQESANTANDALITAIDNLEVLKPANKKILSFVIDYAQKAIDDGRVDALVPTAKANFMAAFHNATKKYNDIYATQDEVDQAWTLLMDAIHTLSFVAGDKSDLNALIAVCDAYDINDIEGDTTAFTTALAAAKVVSADPDAMDSDIQKAHDALNAAMKALIFKDRTQLEATIAYADTRMAIIDLYQDGEAKTAFIAAVGSAKAVLADRTATQAQIDAASTALIEATAKLRFIADKATLEKVLNDAKSIDVSVYTAASVSALEDAIKEGQKVFDDPNATKKEIDAAANRISDAKLGLVATTMTPDPAPTNPENPTTPVDKTDVTADGANGTTNSATTGDSNTLPIALVAGAAAVMLAGVAFKKRKD